MAVKNDTKDRVSLFGVVCLLCAGATPLLWHSVHRLNEVALRASVSLPSVSATEDAVGYWADSAVFLFATAFFSLAMPGDWKIPRWLWPAILLAIFLGPSFLVLGLSLAFPSVYVPSLTTLLMIVGTGVLGILFGFSFGALLNLLKPWLVLRVSLVLAGFSLSVLVALPLGLFGEHRIREREVSLRQRYNEDTIRKAKGVAEDACRQVLAYDSLITDLESQAITAEGTLESGSLASQGPALYYRNCSPKLRQSVKVNMTLKGLGPYRPTPELERLASLTDLQDFSSREANLGATLTQACAPFRDFRLYYGPDRTCYTEEFRAGYDVPPLPDPGDIRIVVRFNLVKNELVGYYEGTNIPGERTTIEVEIISLPARRIVAKKSFLGHPWHSINAGLEIDRVDGADEAIKQGHSWLNSLFAEPDSSQDGGTEPPPARSEHVRSPGP